MKRLYNIFMNKVMPIRTAFVAMFMLLVLGSANVSAQTNVTIGTGTSTNYYPMPGFWGWQYDVYIYDRADINTAGYITKLAYNISSASSGTSSIQIYMKDVETSFALGASTTFASYISGATLVYSNSSLSTPSTGWNTYTLSSQFCHDASKSLMIAVRGVGCGTSGGCSKSVYYTSATGKHWYKHADSSDPGTSVTGAIDANRTNIILTFNGSCSQSGDPCSNVTPMYCGSTYSGTLGTSGQWTSYTSCGYSEPGEERVYSFTPSSSGSYTFTGTNDSGDADFFLMSSCGTSGTNFAGGCWSLGSKTVTLTAGTTYYLIVDNYSSSNTASYTISVDCPQNDPCSNVRTMTCGTTYSGTLGTSGQWSSYSSCSYSEPGEEHVYAFTPTSSGSYTFSASQTTGDPDFFLMSSCGTSGTNLTGGCWGLGDKTVTLTAGTTYYLIVDNYSSSNTAGYTISVTCPAGPCGSATAMTCGTTYSGTLGTSGEWSSYTSCSYSEPGEERVYSFTPSSSGSYTFSATTTTGDPDFFLMSSCGTSGTNLVGGCWSTGNQTVTLTAGTTYYIIADNYRTSENAGYTLSVTCPSGNGPCASATTMTCGQTYTGTLGTSGSWSSYNGCGYSEPGEERVYAFTPTISGSHTFITSTTTGDPDFFLMSSCGTSGTNLVGSCWSTGNQTISLTAGTTYYLIVDNYSSSNSAGYTLSVTCPSDGDITGSTECETAQAFCATNENPGYDMNVTSDATDSPDGMCTFFHNATWWYLRISQDGAIEMEIRLTPNSSSTGDVDFGCWGPFENNTCDIQNDLNDNGANGFTYFSGSSYSNLHNSYNPNNVSTTSDTETPICVVGALASPSGNLVDFGGSTSNVEYLQIPNARRGQIYMVLIANYSRSEGTISFTQTNLGAPGAGLSDCSIVNDCNITSITTIAGDCAGDQTFSLSGLINFTDPPVDGTLTISDGAVSQVFTPPFVSPIAYSLSGLHGDGEQHTIMAAFASSTTNCEKITYIDAPMCEIDCPDATVSMTGYSEVIGDRYYFDVCLGSSVNMYGQQTGYTNPTWRWSINPHGGLEPYVVNTQTAPYIPNAEQGYDVSLTVSEGQCQTVAYGRIRVSGGLNTSVSDYSLGDICVGDSQEITIGGNGSDIQVTPEPHAIETSLGHAETTFIPDGTNCSTQCYTSDVTFYDFDDGAVVTNTDAIKYIKLNTEHSFIGDVQIKITCPNNREAIILPDYYSSDPSSGIYNGNAIDPYTYVWPDRVTTTRWHVGTSATNWYTGLHMLGLYDAFEEQNEAYTHTDGYTYYLASFSSNSDAQDFITNFLSRYYSGRDYTVYGIGPSQDNISYYVIGYTYQGDEGYIVWLTRDNTTEGNAYSFPSQAAAQYFLTYSCGGNGVVSSYEDVGRYRRILFGEPDFYDVNEADNLSATQICNGSDEHNLPGVGFDYAWTSSSQYTTVGYVYDVANMTTPSTTYDNGVAESQDLYHVLPSNVDNGTQMYQPFQSFSNLIGCPLNGTWSISVCDSWGLDNGYVFDWEIALSEDLLPSNWDYTVNLDAVSTDCNSIASVNGNNLTVAPQTASNGEQTCNILLADNLGCSTTIPLSYTAVAPTITHVATSGDENQTVCEDQPIIDIQYTLGGSAVSATATGLPAGVTLTVSGNTVTVSGSPDAHGTYNYIITTVSASGLHCTEVTATGRIIVNEGNITPVFDQAGPYCEGTTVDDLPTTSLNNITGRWSPNITNSTNTYTFTPDAGQCATITTMQITVNPLPTLEYVSGSETLCKGETSANIIFSYGGGANGADVTGLPAGMVFNTDAGAHQIVISGTPTANAGTYSYTITTTGATSPCTNLPVTRTITVTEPATLTLTSGDATQTVCVGSPVNFVYTYGGGAGGAEASGLPSGLTATLNTTNHTLTISGNATAAGSFTVTTTNVVAPCGDVTLTGTVEITQPATLVLLSDSPDAVLCQNGEWDDNIQYEFGGTATGATVTGLPDGLTYDVVGNVVTISGMATAGEGSYTYVVTTTSDPSSQCPDKSLQGVIEISTNATLVLTSAAGTDGQELCLPNQSFTTIVYTYGGGATGANVSDMPAGLTANVNTTAHTVTIAGTPTEPGSYDYFIATTGTIDACKPASTSGNITIGIDPTLEATGSRSQSFCLGNDLSTIVFTYGGGATGVSQTGTLPAGVSAVTDDAAHTLTLSGTPTEAGTFNITVSTTGASDTWNPCEEKAFDVSINVYDTPDVSIVASADEICNGSSVTLTSQPATFNSYRWTCTTSSDATYTVSPGLPTSVTVSSISVNPTVTQGSTDVVYNLRVTDGNGCTADVQQAITVSATPTANVTPANNTKCEEPYNGTITVSGFAGGLSGSTYTVDVTGQASQTTTGSDIVFSGLEAGSYTVTITNESTLGICYTEQTVTIGNTTTSPTVDISGALSICSGTTTTLTAHPSNGAGTFQYAWSDNTTTTAQLTTPAMTVSAPYSVTVTDENGCTASAQVEIQIGELPDVDAVAIPSICFGDDDVLIANVHNAGTGYTLEWAVVSTDPVGLEDYAGLLTTGGERITVTPGLVASFTYRVTLTSTACGDDAISTYTDEVTVMVNDIPKPNIPNPEVGSTEITCDITEITVVATGGSSYVWSNGVEGAQNTFTTEGVYTVTVTDDNSCTASTQVNITRNDEHPNVSITASPSTELTCTNNVITLTGTSTTDNAMLEWTPGSSSPSPAEYQVSAPRIYTVTATDPSNNCKSEASIEITIDESTPTVLIDQPSTITLNCTTQSITLTATGQGTLTWSPSNVATPDNYPASGDYVVTAVADNGCEASDLIHISLDESLPTITIEQSAPALTCTVSQVVLTASGAASYVWNDDNNSTGAQLIVTEGNREYTVVGTASNGCVASETVMINQDSDMSEVSIVPSMATLTCLLESVELTPAADPSYVLTWADGVDPTDIREAGTYMVTATAPNGCQRVATATVLVNRDEPDVTIVPPATTVLTCYNSYNNIPITLEATASEGATLSWDNGTLDVTAPGSYSVTATGENGCSATAEIEITEDVNVPNVEIGNNSNTTVLTCAGPSISVTLIDDSDADDYVWSGGENLTGTGNSFTAPATYYVTATAPNGCTSVDEITIEENITQPDFIEITNNTGTDVLTCDISVISVTAVFEMPAGSNDNIVSYSWSGGSFTNQATNELTTIGSYVVTATASNGCTNTAQIPISETMGRPHVEIDAPNTVLTCTTFELPITAIGDAVSYAWSGGRNPNEAANVVEATGIYTVTATAANGCTAVASLSITENTTPPTVSIRNESGFNQIDCNATSVHAIATGTGVLYQWTGGYEGAEIDLTAAGTYTVTAYGANGCSNTAYVVVTEDFTTPSPTIRITSENSELDCSHSQLTLGASSPDGVLYTWSNNQVGPNITVTQAGQYTVTVKAQNGCEGEASITIDQNSSAPIVYIDNMSGTETLNCNLHSIDIIAQAQNGSQYQFAWGNSLWGGGASQTVTTPGTYTVTVTSANGCTGSADITIRSDNTVPNLNVSSVTGSYELNCTTDHIDVTASGNGVAYAWSGGSNPSNYLNSFVGPGVYTVTSTGSNGCTASASFEITTDYNPPVFDVINETGTYEIDCNNPSIHIIMSNPDVTYRWNDNVVADDRTFTTHGQYTLTATGANGCTSTTSIGILENIVQPYVSITTTPETSELNCLTTAITLTANGGQSYMWSDGTDTQSNTVVTENLYTVTATAANGCTNTATIQIRQAPVFNVDFSSIGTIDCNGGTTSVTVLATGGNPGYTYNWSDGQTSQTATNLTAGNYTVTVYDSGGCSAALQCNVQQPMEITPSLVTRDLQCGVVEGSISAVVVGGTRPYTYIWSNGAADAPDNIGLAVGTYGLTVVDANMCQASAEAQILMQGMLSVNITVSQPISCHGYNDGIIAAQCPDAAGQPYYSWSTGNASPEIYNLFEGAYMVTITDAWGCTGQAGINLVSPPEMNLQTYIESPLCYDSHDGKIVATAFGGVAPYTYLWNTSTTESELTNVGMGTYSLTITDQVGCSAVKSITLEAPAAISIDATATGINCNGEKTGKIEVQATGGVEPYSYSIDNLIRPSMVSVFNNLNAGYYVVRVTDNNGCDAIESVLVYQPDALLMNVDIQHPFCRNSRTGQIEMSAVGGVEPYMYYWNESKSDVAVLPNMPSGEYTLYVVDANGCKSDETEVVLTDVDVPCLRIPNVFTPNGDGVNDTWLIDNVEMFPAAEVYVFNRWGQLMFTSKGYNEPWDGRYRGHFVPAGTYMFIIDLFDDEEPYRGSVTIIY